MVRLLAIFLTCGLLMSCMNSGGKGHTWPKTDLGKERLMGNVKLVEEMRYGVDDNGKRDSLGLKTTERFDIKGPLFEYSDTDFRDSTERLGMMARKPHKQVLVYDNGGRETEQDSYEGLQGEIRSKWLTEYSADGKRSVARKYKNGFAASKRVCVFDSRGNKITDSMFAAHDSLTKSTISKFDSRDNEISESTYDGAGILTEVTTRKYDEFNNEVESDVFDVRSNTHWVEKISYDEGSNPIKRSNYFKDRPANAYTLKYEQPDSHGNWLVQKEYSGDKLQYITERVITYW